MVWGKYIYYEKKVSHFLKKRSVTFLRYAIAIIYFWYGFLKVIGISPVEELIERATHWVFAHEFSFFLGLWEIAIGVFLVIRPLRRVGLWLLFLQFPGTFLPLITNPEDCFTVFPFGLTLEGQYIFKNLILIAAGLVLISSLYAKSEEEIISEKR